MPHLVSNRAVYNVSLEHTSGGGVVAARGRMAIEFRDTCDGWSTAQRLVEDLTDSQGSASRTDFFVTAWESKDGRTMRFDISNTHNGKNEGRQRGAATLALDGSGSVKLAQGKPQIFSLPKGTQFPTGQILEILDAAQASGSTARHIVFQGGDGSDVNFSTATIGNAVGDAALARDRQADPSGTLRNVPAWPVLISYFPLTSKAETPDYEIATHLFANGINGSMSLIYANYTLRATLVRVETLAPAC
jgi:EipB-like